MHSAISQAIRSAIRQSIEEKKMQAVLWTPATLFAASEPGVWYDPSDFSTMFQDSAGTTPVTAVEQPVGLILDKSKGLVLGPELVTNGTFDTNISGWTASGSSPVISWQNGRLQVSGGGNAWAYTSFSVEIGKRYQITLDVFGGAYTARFVIGSASNTGDYYSEVAGGIIGNRQASATFVPTQSIAYILIVSPTGAAVQFDNISVRELPGNHATQTTSTSRPVLSARYNLLTKTQEFDDAAWAKASATITANAVTAPDGTPTADFLIEDNTLNSHRVQQSVSTATGAVHTAVVYAKKNTRSWLALYASGANVGRYFDLNNGVTGSALVSAPTTSTITSVGNGWYRCEITFTATTNTVLQVYLATADGVNNYTGDGTSGIYIWGASLVPANQASLPYQRVNTATDYDADPAKFPPYLRFDGVDDWLVTPTITPGIDKAQVFAGVRKLSDATAMVFWEHGDNQAGGFTQGNYNDHGQILDRYNFWSRGSITLGFAWSGGYPAPTTNVLTGIGDISGDSAILRVNGTQAAISTADQGTGNYLAYPLYIGRRGGTTLTFNGHLYGLIVRFGANLPAGTIASTETWLNQRTGAY